jgi:hypothetical protein
MPRSLVVAALVCSAAPLLAAPASGYTELPPNTVDDEHCIEITVGPKHEPATLCEEIQEGYWRVTRQFVSVTRAGKQVRVLDVTSKVEGSDSGDKWLDLKLRVAADGMSAATVDGVPSTVAGAQPGPTESCRVSSKWNAVGKEFGAPFGPVRKRFCRERGSYKWRGTKFVRR